MTTTTCPDNDNNEVECPCCQSMYCDEGIASDGDNCPERN